MSFYFAHNGVEDGHPNVYTNTIDTTVPGPAEPKAKTNYVMIGSVALIIFVVLLVAGDMIYKKFIKKSKSPVDTPASDASKVVAPTKTPPTAPTV